MARFNGPTALAMDRSNTMYVCDIGNNMVRKVTADGTVTTVAGMLGQSGYIDGPGSSAKFSTLFGVAVGLDGFVYVSDTANSIIRKIDPNTKAVSTFAGSMTRGAVDGYGASASFTYPYGLISDGFGNIIVCDAGNNALRSINATGYVSTVAGNPAIGSGAVDGPLGSSLLWGPYAGYPAPNGDIIFTDAYNNLIRRLSCVGGGCPKNNPYVAPSPASPVVSPSAAANSPSATATTRAGSAAISVNPSLIAIAFAFIGTFVL